MLALASTLCLAAGAVSTTTASATDASATFYMATGAQVNKTNYEYGGIRWAATIEVGYQPVENVETYTFGTFVMPTTAYEAVADGNYAAVEGAVNIIYGDVLTTTLTEDLTYYAAISYDDIVDDYKAKYPEKTDWTDAEIATITKAAYALELTAVSYAKYEDQYSYATVTDTSRSARQVANAAILAGELDGLDESVTEEKTQKDKIKGYVGAQTVVEESAGYIDLTELKAGTAQSLSIADAALANVDWTAVDEVVVGAKNIGEAYTKGETTLSISAAPENLNRYDEEKYAYVSLFMNDGSVYAIPAIAADGVIRNITDLANKLGNATDTSYESGYKTQTGYYVLATNISQANFHNVAVNAAARQKLTNAGGLQNAVFDGQGHSVFLEQPLYGVFGCINNSTVKNVKFTFTFHTDGDAVGLAGYITNSTLENVYVGLVGYGSSSIWGSKRTAPVGRQISGTTFRDCVIDSSAALPTIFSDPSSTEYNHFQYGAIGYTTSTANAKTNTFDNTYVISGLPLFTDYNSVAASTTNAIQNDRSDLTSYYVPHKGSALGISDVLTAAEAFDTEKGAKGTLAGQAAAYEDTYTLSDGSTITLSMSKFSKTAAVWNTGAIDRSFYTNNYYQITGDVHRYNTLALLQAAYQADNTIFAGFSSEYWHVEDGVIKFGKAA